MHISSYFVENPREMGSKCSDYEEIEPGKSWYIINEKEKDDTRDSMEADFRNNYQWAILL